MAHKPFLPLLLLPLLASCAAIANNTQGPTQPQSVSGPCTVKRFFLVGYSATPVAMNVSNTGATCTFTLINPALNAVVDAALLTGQAGHGVANAQLIAGARQVAVSYTPRPGYAGPDGFEVTLEPGAVSIKVSATVSAAVSPGR